MSKQSRSRAAAKATTSAQASATSSAPLFPEPNTFPDRRNTLLAGGVIMLAALAAYHNSFSGPFIFDDPDSITGNPTIRHLWPVWRVLSPPRELTVGGRPLLNLSLALNYAISGYGVWSYHALNLTIHILAGLTLFGIVRLTLQQPVLRKRFGEASLPLALATALLWTVHPLQTESVTYIIQRAESLMGLFYLLTLYCFIRSQDSGDRTQEIGHQRPESGSLPNSAFSFQPSPSVVASPALQSPGKVGAKKEAFWLPASLLCCLLGMAAKEVMVSAPLMVLLYDRTFVAGAFREAWRKRWPYYAGLASTWLLLGGLVASTHGRGGSAGLGTNIAWWAYALAQFRAITHYLQLSLWPSPLVLDYGAALVTQAAEIVPYAMIVLLLAAGTAFALWRRPAVGFAGCWFFAILAPSSSVVPIATQTMAEHRMYLALAPVAALAVLGLYSLLGRRSLVVFLALAAGLGWLSAQRNNDYRSELTIWNDTVAKCPHNARAHDDFGNALLNIPGRLPAAVAQYEAALRIDPDSAEAHNNLGTALLKMPGRLSDAAAQYETALRLKPDYAEALNNLGNALAQMPGQLPAAMVDYKTALRLKPDYAEAHYNLGLVFFQLDRLTDALGEYELAVKFKPDYAEAHNNLGNTLAELDRLPEAIEQYKLALQINPDYANARKALELVRKMMAQPATGAKN